MNSAQSLDVLPTFTEFITSSGGGGILGCLDTVFGCNAGSRKVSCSIAKLRNFCPEYLYAVSQGGRSLCSNILLERSSRNGTRFSCACQKSRLCINPFLAHGEEPNALVAQFAFVVGSDPKSVCRRGPQILMEMGSIELG